MKLEVEISGFVKDTPAAKSGVFDYDDYIQLILDRMEQSSSGPRGKRKQLADAIGCQVSHITHVLSGERHFSAEQAERAARFLGLNHSETEFFLLLVQLARAGTRTLRTFFESLIAQKRADHSNLKSRLKMPDSLRDKDEARYYSSWHYGAAHVALSIPRLQERETMAAAFGWSLARTDEILDFLSRTGLCFKDGSRFRLARPQVHLDKSSPLITKHHANWRALALRDLEENGDRDRPLHYSSVFTVSRQDYSKLRSLLADTLSEMLKTITRSKEEEVVGLCLDFFPVLSP